jgi:hypothetical protein
MRIGASFGNYAVACPDFSGGYEMKNKRSGDACRNGNDSAPRPVGKNAEGKYHQAGSHDDFADNPSHRLALRGLGMLAVLATQVRQQEQQWKRQRPDKNPGNPCPVLEAASATLGSSAGKINRTDNSDQGNGVHDARSDAALR